MIRINLVPGERPAAKTRTLPKIPRARADWLPRSPAVLVGFLGIAVVLVMVFLYFGERRDLAAAQESLAGAEADSARLHSALVRVQSMEAAQKKLAARVGMMRNVVEGRLFWIQTMETLSKELPPYTWLTRVDREDLGPNQMRIAGASFANAAVTEYMRGLEASPQLKNVTLIGVTRSQQDSLSYQSFTLVADYEDYQPVVIAPADTTRKEGS